MEIGRGRDVGYRERGKEEDKGRYICRYEKRDINRGREARRKKERDRGKRKKGRERLREKGRKREEYIDMGL